VKLPEFTWPNPGERHRNLSVDGKLYCGDFVCEGSCGLAKLVCDIADNEENTRKLRVMASALYGLERVFGRKFPHYWKGPVEMYTKDIKNLWWY